MFESLRQWLHSIANGRKRQETRYLCCGDCCELFGGHLNASTADLERWRTQGREDLLERDNRLGWIWMAPQTGQPAQRCPFINRLMMKPPFAASTLPNQPCAATIRPWLTNVAGDTACS